MKRPGRTAAPSTHLAALLVGAMLALVPATAAAQSSQILIEDLTIAEDGTATMDVVVSPDVPPDQVEDGLRVVENGEVVDDVTLERVSIGSEDARDADVALLIDTSDSTSQDGALAAAQSAAADFVRRVTDEGVSITLVAFASTAEVLVEASTDADALDAAIQALEPSGDTALYDAVDVAVSQLALGSATSRELVIFTDGGDTVSTATLDGVTAAANQAQVDITAVSLTTGETDEAALSQLAAATTGGLVIPVSDAARLGEVLGGVAASIAERLVVSWALLDPEAATVEVSVVLVTPSGQFSDRATVTATSAVTPAASDGGAALQPVTTPEPLLVSGGLALWLGLFAALVAMLLLLVVLFTSPSSARGSRVLRRQVDPSKEDSLRQVGPDDLRLKELLGQIVDALPRPSGFDERIQRELDQAQWPLRSGEFVALRVALGVAGLLFGLLLSALSSPNPVLPTTFAVAGFVAPRLILEQRKRARFNAFHEQMPETLQMLAGSLRAGYGLAQGLDNVSREGPVPTATEFGRVLTETRLGVPLEDALAAMADRIASDDFRWVTVAISIQRRVGGNLAELMDTVAATLREREQVRRQVSVLSAEGRLSAVILIALPIVFALYLGATRPEYLQPLFTWPVGYGLLLLAAGLLAAGVAWIRQVIRIDV